MISRRSAANRRLHLGAQSRLLRSAVLERFSIRSDRWYCSAAVHALLVLHCNCIRSVVLQSYCFSSVVLEDCSRTTALVQSTGLLNRVPDAGSAELSGAWRVEESGTAQRVREGVRGKEGLWGQGNE
eukprot:2230461-Rhodomonas_salina.1